MACGYGKGSVVVVIEWLQLCCSDDELRPHLTKPFPVTHDRKRYAAATDGHILLLVQGFKVPKPKNKPPAVESLIDSASFRHLLVEPISLEALRAWAECDLTRGHEVVCPACEGKKSLPCGTCGGEKRYEHDCGCEHCYREWDDCTDCEDGTDECFDCDGTGVVAMPPVPGRICGAPIDRRLVYRVVRDAPGETVRIGSGDELDPIAFIGDGWRALVMPVRESVEFGADQAFAAQPVVQL